MSSLATRAATTRLLALAMAKVLRRPAAVSMFGTRSTAPPVSASSALTCAGESTLDIMMKSGRPASTPTRSSRPQVSSGLMRTPARAPAARHSSSTSAACARAFGRSSGGVKSSSSRMMASAPERPAARCAASSAPATKSQERRGRGLRVPGLLRGGRSPPTRGSARSRIAPPGWRARAAGSRTGTVTIPQSSFWCAAMSPTMLARQRGNADVDEEAHRHVVGLEVDADHRAELEVDEEQQDVLDRGAALGRPCR